MNKNYCYLSQKVGNLTWLIVSLISFVVMSSSIVMANDAVKYAQTVTGEVQGLTILVSGKQGVLPKGTTLKLEVLPKAEQQVYIKDLEKTKEKAFNAIALDITLLDEAGKEVQPNGEVLVTISGHQLTTDEQFHVYHVEKNKDGATNFEEKEVKNEKGTTSGILPVSFKTTHFSIYLVAAPTYTHTYYFFDEGKEITEFKQIVKNGETLLAPAPPIKDNKVFLGWFDESDNKVDFDKDELKKISVIGYNKIKLTAKFEPRVYVYFKHKDGHINYQVIKTKWCKPGDKVDDSDIRLAVTTKDKIFLHWSTSKDGAAFNFSTTSIDETISLYAVLKDGYTVNFDGKGGVVQNKESVLPQYLIRNEPAVEPNPAPTKPGYTFKHWSETPSGAAFNFNTKIIENKTLHAVWTPKQVSYTVVHLTENANDDKYSFKEAESKTGTAGTNTYAIAKNYNGFDVEPIIQNKIKGDGSTIVYVKYKRQKYQIKFYKYNYKKSFEYVGEGKGDHIAYKKGYEKVKIGEGEYFIRKDNVRGYYSVGANNGEYIKSGASYKKVGWGKGDYAFFYKDNTWPKFSYAKAYDKAGNKYGDHLWHGSDGYREVGAGKGDYKYNPKGMNEIFKNRITAKHGADITEKWPGGNWRLGSGNSDVYRANQLEMPLGGEKYYFLEPGSTTYRIYYYVEALPGEGETAPETGCANTSLKYVLHHEDEVKANLLFSNYADRYAIKGFTYDEHWIGEENFIPDPKHPGDKYLNNCYKRNIYVLKFYNRDKIINKATKNIYFDEPLNKHELAPPTSLPTGVKPGSTFGGWYDNEEGLGDPVDFTNRRMPADNLIVYAKWIPPVHKLTAYKDDNIEVFNEFTAIPDNDILTATQKGALHIDDLEDDKFVGWYWYVHGKFVPYDFERPIDRDIKIYQVWDRKGFKVVYKIPLEYDGQVEAPKPDDGNEYLADTYGRILPPKFVAQGQKFLGWKDKLGRVYQPNDAIHVITEHIVAKEVVLKPIISDKYPPKTKLTYKPNYTEGIVPSDKVIDNLLNNETETVKLADTFTRSYYNFKEWNTSADGNGVSYAPGKDIIVDKESENILYAIWECKEYKIEKIEASSEKICEGEKAVFTITGTIGAFVTYQFNDDKQQTGEISSAGKLEVTKVNTIAGKLSLKLMKIGNGDCMTELTNQKEITVFKIPTFELTPNPAKCNSETSKVTVKITSGIGKYTIYVYVDGTEKENKTVTVKGIGNDNIFDFTVIKANEGGKDYTVKVKVVNTDCINCISDC